MSRESKRLESHDVDTMPGEVPSAGKLLKATVLALIAAAAIFFVAVLPAETGKDPLGTGKLLGLTSLANSGAPGAGAAAGGKEAAPAEIPAPVVTGVYFPQPASYKVDSRTLRLRGGEGIEIKYHMAMGAGMVYSWTSTGKVLYEFHGEPDVKPKGAPADYFESYDKDEKEGKDKSFGTFTAPSTGIQGWFWENTGDDTVTVKLTTAGFYDYILQNKDDVKTRLQPSDPK